nr:hypothetical protein [Tanacetum cinerariifolium]
MNELKKCIFNGPYVMTRILVVAKPTTEIDPPIPEHTVEETYENTLLENYAYIDAEAEAIHMILSGIRDEIYSTVDACKIAKEMWTAIERLQQDNDPEQAERDKYMQKSITLSAKYFTKICKPTSNNLRTSSNLKNKNVDSTLRTKNDRQTGQFRNQRTVTVAGDKKTVGNQVVQKTRIQCFNCKEYGHFAKECRKPKRVKDYSYHKEKMMLYKQKEKGVPLSAEHSDWLHDTNEEPDEKELEAHYMYMKKI